VNFKIFISKYIPILFFLISFFLSINFNRFNTDWHHHARMFVEANQLVLGLIPYKEIFITYGMLTTLIHALSIIFFGNQILSPHIITAFFYALTFPIFFLILKNFKIKTNIAILSTFLVILIHPSIVLPWANYIAYFFLLLGVYYLTKDQMPKKNFFLLGFFWSLSCLSRQTFFMPISLVICIIMLATIFIQNNIFFFHKNNIEIKKIDKKNFNYKNILILIFAFFIPFFIFFLYLFLNEIFNYWKFATFDISQSYLPTFRNLNNHIIFSYLYFAYDLFRPLMSNLILSIKNLDLRYFIFFLILISNIFFLIFFFLKKKNLKIFYLSCLGLLLFSESIHLPEIFRMSTGPIIAFIPIIFFFKNILKFKYILFLFIFFLMFTWHGGIHNYVYHYYYKSSDDYIASNNKYFKFSRQPKNIVNFYDAFQSSIDKINNQYVINWNYNYSGSPMLALISKTKSYQMASFYDERFQKIYLKRNDIILENAFKKFNDLVIFYPTNDDGIPLNLNDSFYIFEIIDYPFEQLRYLLILLPNNVIQKGI